MAINKYTLILHEKGWTVVNACKYWGMRYETFYSRSKNKKFEKQLECMCKGLPGFDHET